MTALRTYRATAALAAFLAVGAGSAVAQSSCASGPPSDAHMSVSWVEPQPVAVAQREVIASLGTLGYAVTASTPGIGAGPRYTWPRSELFRPWRALRYPGAELTVATDTAGPWTRLVLSVRLVCATGQRPPTGYPADVEFDSFVLEGTVVEAEGAITHALERLKVAVLDESCAALRPGKRAIDTCRLIARRRPADPDVHLQHAIHLVRAHRPEESWDPMRKVFGIEGERAAAFLALGDAMLEAREFESAARLYERGIELWPRDARMAFRFGRATLELGNPDQALPSLLAASALDPAAPEGHWYAAAVLSQLGRANEARQHCDAAVPVLSALVQREPRSVDGWLGLTVCAHVLEQHEKALIAYQRALAADGIRAQTATYVISAVRESLTRVGSQEPGSR